MDVIEVDAIEEGVSTRYKISPNTYCMFDKKYAEETGKLIGAAMEVHNHLGNGFQEVILFTSGPWRMNLNYNPFLLKENLKCPCITKANS